MAGYLKKTLPIPLYRFLINSYKSLTRGFSIKSYSQEGEDMVLNRIFENQKTGFFVDVGAHHPIRFSNTYLFYKKGWMGINIDCNPGSMALFSLCRRRDINLELAVSDRVETLKYHKFSEPAINSFTADFSEGNNSENTILKTIEMKTVTLESIFHSHIPDNTHIDFLSVDVEGMDLKVLRSNNWTKYRPKMVLAEDILYNYEFATDSEIVRFMASIDYVLFAKTVNTFIFRERFFKPF